ncbi:hypothetical protein DNK56_26665 [Streptomyces sp. AC1-42W]|nr:hypothetical protein DNK56_26665 [Streptomyces sp. AC1-42W]PZT80556.1 hypothetical protein DNK55_06015 [Streptomyces sp. AC1-42T]
MDVGDTVGLVRRNRKTRKRLQKAAQELDQQAAEDSIALNKARQMLYDVAVLPFRDVYGRMKNVDHFELATIERPTASVAGGVELRRTGGTAAAQAARMAGGAVLVFGLPFVVGHAAKSGSYRAVQSFGSASTGRAIKTLRGAVARNAAEAWFGGGAVAFGGGGRAAGRKMLDQIEATSSKVTFELAATWRIQALEASKQEEARGLERREAAVKQRQDEALALHERFEGMQRVIQDLRSELLTRLPSLIALVDNSDDFARYDSRQCAEVTTMVDLDGLAVKVMRCPMVDPTGRPTEESKCVVAEVEARLQAMQPHA